MGYPRSSSGLRGGVRRKILPSWCRIPYKEGNTMCRRFKADDPERRRWQDPDRILSAVGVKQGMTFIDLGCGEGFFALPAARLVGPGGHVFAADINAEAIAQLEVNATAAGLHNITSSVAEAEESEFCHHCADFVFFGNNLHDFRVPEQVIANAGKMLSPGGSLIDLDWKDQPMDLGPPLEKRFSLQKATRMITAAGFRIRVVRDEGPYHYLIQASP